MQISIGYKKMYDVGDSEMRALNFLLKARSYPDGTKRTHGGRPVVKRGGKWVPDQNKKDSDHSDSRIFNMDFLVNFGDMQADTRQAIITNLVRNRSERDLTAGLDEIAKEKNKRAARLKDAPSPLQTVLIKDLESLTVAESMVNDAIQEMKSVKKAVSRLSYLIKPDQN